MKAPQVNEAGRSQKHVRGLDSIRFICALWVFFGHGGEPPLPLPFPEGTPAHQILRGIYGNLWSGPSAVIIFFIISGFCIHYPFLDSGRPFVLREFYSRRLLRLLIPLAVAIPLSSWLGAPFKFLHESVLWSLLAELVYYLLYPVLRIMRARVWSWSMLIMLSYLASLVLAKSNPTAGNYPSFGPWLNWLMGLPCWLLGCRLAETIDRWRGVSVSAMEIWMWRGGVYFAACACSVLRFHSPIGYPWTLNLFAFLATGWLGREIGWREQSAPFSLLEDAGAWSYSLYLMHGASGVCFFSMLKDTGMASPWLWPLEVTFVLGASYGFYLLVERPGHRFARQISLRFGQPETRIPVGAV